MSKRPTIKDVAQEAGVSVATVNRVIAGTGTVRAETGRAVAEAAHRIGYHAVGLIEHRLSPHCPQVRLGFVLRKQKQEFYQNFAEELRTAAADCKQAHCLVDIVFADSQAPGDLAGQLRDLSGRVDVIAATAINHPAISAAVQDLKAAGLSVFALLSDFAQGERIGYVGLNNLTVGRGAGSMLSLAARQPGKIAIIVGGHRWHGHDLRETGIRGFFREDPRPFAVLDPLVNLETRDLTHEATLNLLERHPDVVGIYVAGGGMEGAIRALRELRAPREVALVVNELTRESHLALADGYVTLINATPIKTLSQVLVELMVTATSTPETVPGQRFFAPVLHLPEFDS